MFKVGTVDRYYEKTGIAIVTLTNTLSVGDTIEFRTGPDVISQKVDIIQIGTKKVDSANRGEVIALKTNKNVQEEAEVYKIG